MMYPLGLGAGVARGGEQVELTAVPMKDCTIERVVIATPANYLMQYVPPLGGIVHANEPICVGLRFPAAPRLSWWKLRARFRRWRDGGRVWPYSAALIVRDL